MLNSVKARPKMSKVERKMNKHVFVVFLVQIVFCLICSVSSSVWFYAYKVIRNE